ncbi:Penicillin binding protein transpeptidase domain-containing protein [Parafrankia irregularis]|uniref:Penicillin binding protein transpeptidase domain-containing protein n=1 Tax=Parafrankia irregularis TaxID=795642 RepID=A0A0S4QU99_9ACTN|nr:MULTISPECIES: penicillin-binding transpeptidase domain-containing protein [Parafrankia]MBE3203658.1 penicillin-binding protein [Parafrankia sp. CH37]CUU59101.1 Penicillin binding protein transpeptidase domain-containing protein [Parafrankia irregularis]
MDPWTSDPVEDLSGADTGYESENSAHSDAEYDTANEWQHRPPSDPGRGREEAAGPAGRHGHHGRRKPWKFIALVTTVAAVLVVGVTATIVDVVVPGRESHPVVGFVPTGASPEQDGEQITTAFLSAWAAGSLELAASYTDSPQAAEEAFAAYREGLHLTTLSGSSAGATRLVENATSEAAQTPRIKVAIAVNALVAAPAGTGVISGTWSYHSSLVAYQKPDSPAWSIAWAPDVLAPNLTAATHPAAVPLAPTATSVVDSSGNSLTSYQDAGLNTIAGILKSSPPENLGQPGLAVEIQSAAGTPVRGTRTVISAPVAGTLATTISAGAEQAARGAVAEHPDSSLVAIQPSTGHILAIANNAGYNDFALTAAVAPGSTGKIISAAALISHGVVTANTPVACPAVYTVQGISYHNDKGESEPASTPFSRNFAQSCNNAFSQWWQQESNGRLASVAKEYFGLNQPWDIGLGRPATYYNQPATASGSELAQNMFGQGHITASPLAMASVAATVADGTFKQPILLPGASQIAATPLPAGVDSQLKTMMREVVAEGTAAGLGFGPTVHAKTGTSDVDNQEQPNSWFVAFDPARDVAVACLVLNAGHGAQFAAPEVLHFLASL